MVLPTSPPDSMSVGINIYAEFGIPALTTKRISQDLFPLVGGTAGSQCFLGASFSGKSAGTLAGYSTIKGSGTDIGYSIALDSSQNIYVTGYYTSSVTVPINTFETAPTATGVSLPITPNTDVFVIKWNANGTLAGYSTISGINSDVGNGIAVDSSQNIYVIGVYTSTATVPINTFGTAPTSTGVSMPIATTGSTFVIKWNANGTLAGYSNLDGNNIGRGIAVDSSQNIYVTGQYTSASGVPIRTFGTAPTASGINLPVTGSNDVFVIKWNANGTLAGYSTIRSAGTGSDIGYGIAVDSSQNIYVTGQYTSTATVSINTFGTAPTATGVSLPISTSNDVFVIKWNANGTLAGYSTIKATGSDVGRSIAVDSSQNIYVTGQYNSTTAVPINTFGTAPTATGVSLPVTAVTDMFVIKWNANGTLAGYSTIIGSGSDVGNGVAVDSSQNIYVTGQYTSTVPINTFGTAPTATGVSLPVTAGTDMFVIKWNANGTLAGYSTIKGSGIDIGNGIAVDSSGKIYVTGQYNSTTAVPINTFGTAPTATGVSLPVTAVTDMFVIKWNS
jgi:predicted NAD/FAD-binding protein